MKKGKIKGSSILEFFILLMVSMLLIIKVVPMVMSIFKAATSGDIIQQSSVKYTKQADGTTQKPDGTKLTKEEEIIAKLQEIAEKQEQ